MTFLGLQWLLPYVLLLLPLSVLPWFSRILDKTVAWVDFIPVDPVSKFIGIMLKLLASIVILSLIFALAGPYLPEKKIERIGAGAEIVLVLDRSRSMDIPFAVKNRAALVQYNQENSKRRVALKYLTEFVNKRPDDRFGFVLFSSNAIALLALTYNKKAILATINASSLGKGLSETNMAAALVRSAMMFEGKMYRGSRIVLLVSDGGQHLNEEEQAQIRALYRRLDLTLYWVYMRTIKGMTLDENDNENRLWKGSPERKLHSFFKSLNQPYRVFETEELKDFSEALDDIDQQQYQTLVVEETVPRESKEKLFYWLAMNAMILLVLAQLYTVRGVKKAHK